MSLGKITAAIMVIISSILLCANKEKASIGDLKKKPEVIIKTSMGTIKIELWNDIAPVTVNNFVSLADGTREWIDPKTGMKVKKQFFDGLTFHKVIKGNMIQAGSPLGTENSGPGYIFDDEIYDNTGTKEIKGKIKDEETAFRVFNEIIVPYMKRTYQPDWDREIEDIAMECNQYQSGDSVKRHPVEFYIKKTGHKKPFITLGKLKASVGYGNICMANNGPDTNGSQFFIVTRKDGLPQLNGKNTVFGKVIEGMDIAERIQNVGVLRDFKPVRDVTIQSVTIIK